MWVVALGMGCNVGILDCGTIGVAIGLCLFFALNLVMCVVLSMVVNRVCCFLTILERVVSGGVSIGFFFFLGVV